LRRILHDKADRAAIGVAGRLAIDGLGDHETAQIILTAIAFDLMPLVEDRASSAPPRISLSKIVTFDA
jgi:hypothetical protein